MVTSRPQRRKLVWATVQTTAAALTVNSTGGVGDLLANLRVAGSSVLGATVMRTHARLELSSATTDNAAGFVYGFAVDDATELGGTNLDLTSLGADWMLYDTVTPASSPSIMTVGTTFIWHRTIDLKAKRRLEELNESYRFSIKNEGGATADWSLFARILVALP